MRKTVIFLAALLVTMTASPQAVDLSIKKAAVGGVRVTNPNWDPGVPAPIVYTPVWYDGIDDNVEPPTSYTLQKNVAFSLSLAGLCKVPLAAPVGTLTFSKTAGSYPAGLNLVTATFSGTPSAVESQAITWRCTFTPDVGSPTTDDWNVTLDVTDPDSTAPTAPGNFACAASSTTSVLCGWLASTDASGVRNYYVSSSGNEGTCNSADNNVATVASPTLTYERTGLTANTTYWFKIKADDNAAAHNTSAYAACVPGTTAADTPPPPPPPDPPPGNGGGGSGTALLFDNGWENYTTGDLTARLPDGVYTDSVNGAGTLAVDTTHAREGVHSLHTKITRNGTTAYREEVRLQTSLEHSSQTNSAPVWYGISYFIPSTSACPSNSVFYQTHVQTADANNTSPVFGLRHVNANMTITREVGTNSGYTLAPITTNQWVDMVYKILWRQNATGSMQIWKNGVEVLNVANLQTGPDNETWIPYLKYGIYASPWKNSGGAANGTVCEGWFDAQRICQGNTCVYADVAPQGDRLAAP